LGRAVNAFLVAGVAVFITTMTAAGQTAAPASGGPAKQGAGMTNAQSTDVDGAKPPPPTASTTAYKDAAVQLQVGLAVRYTGDADKDFASVIAAYHTGAIAAANIELKYGTNAEMRHLAEKVIAASEKDIAHAQAWQDKHR
jgi:uncharacterized protein (DUF305 family)